MGQDFISCFIELVFCISKFCYYRNVCIIFNLSLIHISGDKSDNIIGVPGVGAVSAVKLIKEYGLSLIHI